MKPIIYRITHLWPNKQPGQGLTAEIEEDQERWTIYVCDRCGEPGYAWQSQHSIPFAECSAEGTHAGREYRKVEVVPAPDNSSTVQIKPETDELNALPSRFVSLPDYEALEREKS